MSVVILKTNVLAASLEGGISYEQAMEMFARFFERLQAVPTIASEMRLQFDLVVRVFDGRLWPAARAYWVERLLP